jgi:hypothetical protein
MNKNLLQNSSNNIWFYKLLLKLPNIPQHLIDNARKKITGEPNFQSSNHKLIDWKAVQQVKLNINGVEKFSVTSKAWHVDNELVDWVKENIVSDGLDHVRINCNQPYDNNDVCGAHTDHNRNYSLLYVLEQGGDNVVTAFYKEKDKPLLHEHGYRVTDYSKLEYIEGIVIPKNCWCLLNVKVLHGINNIVNDRINIQIGLENLSGLKI